MKLRFLIVLLMIFSIGIISIVSAEKTWGNEGYKEYLEFTEDYVMPGIMLAPSWPDAPINSPGFSLLINSVADGLFSGIPSMTYSDVDNIRPDIDGQSWEELFHSTPQSPITIGVVLEPMPSTTPWTNGTGFFIFRE